MVKGGLPLSVATGLLCALLGACVVPPDGDAPGAIAPLLANCVGVSSHFDARVGLTGIDTITYDQFGNREFWEFESFSVNGDVLDRHMTVFENTYRLDGTLEAVVSRRVGRTQVISTRYNDAGDVLEWFRDDNGDGDLDAEDGIARYENVYAPDGRLVHAVATGFTTLGESRTLYETFDYDGFENLELYAEVFDEKGTALDRTWGKTYDNTYRPDDTLSQVVERLFWSDAPSDVSFPIVSTYDACGRPSRRLVDPGGSSSDADDVTSTDWDCPCLGQ